MEINDEIDDIIVINEENDNFDTSLVITDEKLISKDKLQQENDKKEIDIFNITTSGDLGSDLKKMEIKMEALPDIEVREVVIKKAGNFLNLKDNVINIPIEMLIFPFFTPQKQNKRINFQYIFEDMGVKMHCTLIAKNSNDKVFQPSIFEEKIYTYLISMYEGKMEADDNNEYIDFEINDFIVNFLGNKMNRTYYTKVEQSLKNLKNTEYQFVVSNHTKFGKYKFEDEEFKLLTYQKLKVGKKIYYRIILNKNIRKKIKDKRYIKYNSKTLVEMMNLDPIAARIYKYISQMRYDKNLNTINIRTLSAIIPLKTEQITERVGKDGEKKLYTLCRLKQVLNRIEKAYDVLVKLKYIKKYKSEYDSFENTYYLTYEFNKAKDGTCHISEYIIKGKEIETIENHIEKEAHVIEKINKKPKQTAKEIKKSTGDEYSEKLMEKLKKVKRNRYVNNSWDKRAENKINKILQTYGEEFTIMFLKEVYKSLNAPISKSLVQYFNGVINNIMLNEKIKENQPLTLFGMTFSNKGDTTLNKLTTRGIKRAAKNFDQFTFGREKNSEKDKISKVSEIVKNDVVQEIKKLGKNYDELDQYEKLKVEEKAIKLCCAETGMTEKALLTLKEKLKPAYNNTIKIYIEKILSELI